MYHVPRSNENVREKRDCRNFEISLLVATACNAPHTSEEMRRVCETQRPSAAMMSTNAIFSIQGKVEVKRSFAHYYLKGAVQIHHEWNQVGCLVVLRIYRTSL